ncbi:hypothetical protein G6L37_01495 [Agrobacterium rubi]|nr:hypothetical protein [Agrobacterium rubi]NTF24067.1 hypothetical protein [Agrobacterium rubi]
MSEQFRSLEVSLLRVEGQIHDVDGGHEVHIDDVRHPVKVIVAGVLFPRDAKSLVWNALEAKVSGQLPIIAAEVVSEGAREFLRSQKVGYSDMGGSLYLPLNNALIMIDRAPPKREKRVVKSVLSGKTSLAAHVLMSSDEPLNGVDIAAMTGLSMGGVSGALDKLDRMGWLSTDGSGPRKLRRISDRRALLDHWKQSRQGDGPVGKERFYVPGVSGGEALARKISEAAAAEGIPYMVTGVYGSQIHAPYLSSIAQVVCRVLPQDMERIAEALGARKVSEGWNLGLISSDIPMSPAFVGEVDGLSVASPLVCWIDTVSEPGRAKELADHLASERLIFSAPQGN